MADVHSAGRKPQMYKDPETGKMKVRMVPSKQDVKSEKILTPAEKRGRERIAKKLPMKDFKKRYGDDAMAVKMATATNIAKKKYEGDNEASGVEETKGAPKGYHFTRSGKLRKGDADVDGPGGKKLRADPLDKQRSKIPPLPEKFASAAQQAAVMAKLKKDGKYKGESVEEAVTYHGNPNKDDDARNAARRRALAKQDNLLRKRKAEKEKQESMSVPVRDVPASTDDIAKAKKAISQGMPRHKAQAKYLVKSTDLQKKTQSYGDLLKYGRKDEQVEEHFNWKVSHAGKDVHVKAPHAGAAVKKAQKGFGNMDLTKAKITNLGKVGTPAKEEVEEVFAGHYSMPSKRQIGRASDEPNTGPRNTYRPRPSLSPRSLNKKLYGKAMGSTMKGEEQKDKPPFDGPYTSNKEPRKDEFGNIVKKKNIASFLAKKGMKSASKTEAKVDEISTDLKKRYIDKAKSDYGHQQYSRDIARDMGADKETQKHYTRKMQKRMGGIGRAVATMGESVVEAKAFDQKFKDHLKFATSKSKSVQDYMKKKVADRNARHAKQDPAAVKKNYGPAVIPPGTAYNKASKRGMNPSQAANAVSTAFKNRAKGRKLPEETQLDEMKANAAYTKAAKDIKAYAAKDGGIDKKDMMNFAADLELMGRAPNILQAGRILDRINKRFKGYDTDVRDRLSMYLKKHGLME